MKRFAWLDTLHQWWHRQHPWAVIRVLMLIGLVLSPCAPQVTERWPMVSDESRSVWSVMRRGFLLDHHLDHPRVRYWIEWYQNRPYIIERYVRDAEPWLFYVTQAVEDRGMPSEVALLPFIESGYDPLAKNGKGATGLWQFTSATAQSMGLTASQEHDPRYNPIAATTAALDYFNWLSRYWYNNDWVLMFAVYNAGVGRVNRAIDTAGSRNFWQLPLPGETRDYVPRLLALSAIIDAPHHYGIDLPNVPARPAFVSVKVQRKLPLDAIPTSSTTRETVKALNPAHRTAIERHQELLLPAQQAHGIICKLQTTSVLSASEPCDSAEAE